MSATRRRLAEGARDESGIALVMAVGILFVLSITLASIVQYTSANDRNANHSQAGQSARTLAEAGLNNSLSVLFAAADPSLATLLSPARTSTYAGGTATWSGVFDEPRLTWRLTSTGTVRNPTGPGAAAVTRTLTVNVPMRRILTQANSTGAWNWIYASLSTGALCDMTISNKVDIAAPLWVEGNLCIEEQAIVSKGPLVVGGQVTLKNPHNRIGSSTNRMNTVHIVKGCQYSNNPLHVPCHGPSTGPSDPVPADADNVFVAPGGFYSALPDPRVNFPRLTTAEWRVKYGMAMPGPAFPCYPESKTGTPPAFDTPSDVAAVLATVPPADRTVYMNNNVPTIFNLTPATSYTCKSAGGHELSWNATDRVLTANGTIFIDGSVVVENGAVNRYEGMASLYVSGTFLIKNSKLCAKLTADKSDCNLDPSETNWNPNTTMLVVHANGNGSNPGPEAQVSAGDSVQLVSGTFQGGLYGTNAIDITTTSRAQGPMMGSTVILGQTGYIAFPKIDVLPAGAAGLPMPSLELDPPQDFG